MSAHTTLATLAARQHGLFTNQQALAAGLTRGQLDAAVRSGRYERKATGVLGVAGTGSSWEQQALAAVLASGPGAVLSHRSAAHLWGLDGSRAGIVEITVPRHRRPWRHTGIRVHESTDLELAEPTTRRRIPVTGIVRTLVDLGTVVPAELLGRAVDDAIRRRFTSWPQLAAVRARHARRGRNGVGRLRELLEIRYGTTIPDSHFGRLVADLLVDAGLPAPVVEHDVHDDDGRWLARVDLAYPEARVAVELDSVTHHLNEPAFEADRPRQNRLELAGWLVLRYTWRFYSRHPQRLCDEVAAALTLRGQR